MKPATWLTIVPGLFEACAQAYKDSDVCPPRKDCLRALEQLALPDVRVVILGQDPYHTPGKASGLAFGYHSEYAGPIDSSLRNILTEMGCVTEAVAHGARTLAHLPPQGVLLLNTRLTVLTGQPLSHAYPQGPGWEPLIRSLLTYLWLEQDCVWLLWGAEARRAAYDAGVHLGHPNVFLASHPCRFSHERSSETTIGGRRYRIPAFTGSGCFEETNRVLRNTGQTPINWLGTAAPLRRPA